MSDEEALVAVGVVARPHGVRGELRVHRLNPESTLLFESSTVTLRQGDASRVVSVERARMGPKGMVLMTLGTVVGRESADALRGAEVCVPRSALPPTDDDEWYFIDLIGLSASGEGGEALGTIVDVVEYPTITCLCVRDGEDVREVPMIPPYLVDVDLDEGRVVLGLIADLPARKPTKYEQTERGT